MVINKYPVCKSTQFQEKRFLFRLYHQHHHGKKDSCIELNGYSSVLSCRIYFKFRNYCVEWKKGYYHSKAIRILSPLTRTGYCFRDFGGCCRDAKVSRIPVRSVHRITCPSRRSNCEWCIGQVRVVPWSVPSDRSPSRCGQSASTA